MSDLSKKQAAVLSELCETLNKRKVAAELTGDNKEFLSLLLDKTGVDEDVFIDIAFMPEKEQFNDISFCIIESRLKNLSGIEKKDLAELSALLSYVNSRMMGGSFSIEIKEEDESASVGYMIYRYTFPVVPEITEKNFKETIDSALSLVSYDLKTCLPGIYSVLKGEMTIDGYLKEVL